MNTLLGSHRMSASRDDVPPDAGFSIISAVNIGYAYENGTRAIGDLSFDLRVGEFLSIVGPSGCGKSTLLRIIAGLRQPTGGTISRSLGESGRHGCSMVFQEDTLLPWLTIEENVGLHYRFKRDRSPRVKEHVAELLEMVRLSAFAKSYPFQLSGGMRRRVAILAAVAPLPDLLLLDEPFSALDEPTRIAIHGELHSILKRLGITAVLVTHDLTEAISLSDRVHILSKPPAHLIEEIDIPFGDTRDMYNLRDRPEFLTIYGRLWKRLKEQIHEH